MIEDEERYYEEAMKTSIKLFKYSDWMYVLGRWSIWENGQRKSIKKPSEEFLRKYMNYISNNSIMGKSLLKAIDLEDPSKEFVKDFYNKLPMSFRYVVITKDKLSYGSKETANKKVIEELKSNPYKYLKNSKFSTIAKEIIKGNFIETNRESRAKIPIQIHHFNNLKQELLKLKPDIDFDLEDRLIDLLTKDKEALLKFIEKGL